MVGIGSPRRDGAIAQTADEANAAKAGPRHTENI